MIYFSLNNPCRGITLDVDFTSPIVMAGVSVQKLLTSEGGTLKLQMYDAV